MIAVAVVLAVVLATTPPVTDPLVNARATDKEIVVEGMTRAAAPASSRSRSGPRYEHERLTPMFCGTLSGDLAQSPVPCVDDAESGRALRQCADGTRALGPLMRRLIDDDGTPLSDWEQVDNGGCPEESVPDVVLTAAEFRRLPLEVRAPVIQPFDGRALVTMGIAAHTDGSAQELMTTVVGVPVRVRATPVQFAWDFGDGSAVIRTTVAGHEWPHHAALGEYPEPGEFQLRLTTTWRGEFQVNGAGPWLPVSGTASTTSDPIAISVETAPARLVSEF